MLIEQAIFTSDENDRAAGYQLVRASSGVSEADARELSAWGPSHDSLVEAGDDAVSINFHPLPSGAFCISKTTPAGGEYSGRDGARVYTQCLVVPASVLARFSNNPFALLTAAFAQGLLRVYDRMPDVLEPFRLGGRATVVDQALLSQLVNDPGPSWLGAMTQAAISTPWLLLAAGPQRPRLIAGILNCVPPECRTEFSFSTGLKHSPKRPFRILCVGDDANEQRRLARQYDFTVLDLTDAPPAEYSAASGWGGFIATAVAAGKGRFLNAQFSEPRHGLAVTDLDALGDRLIETMAAESHSVATEPAVASATRVVEFDDSPSIVHEALLRADLSHATAAAYCSITRDDVARAQTPQARPSIEALARDGLLDDPSQVLGWHSPETLEKLEQLDDTVFEAIAGKRGASDALRRLWPSVVAELPAELVDESRMQYVRHAMRIWKECIDGHEIRNPGHAIAAMEVISLLLDE